MVGGALTRSKDFTGWVIEEYKKRVGKFPIHGRFEAGNRF